MMNAWKGFDRAAVPAAVALPEGFFPESEQAMGKSRNMHKRTRVRLSFILPPWLDLA